MPILNSRAWDRLTILWLLVFAAALPHSIAVSQIGAGLAALTWLVGLAVQRKRPKPTALDLPILVFILASALAALFSLEPAVSIHKLRSTALVLIVPLTAGVLNTRRQALLVVLVLLGSASVSAGPVVWKKILGRGVEVLAVTPGSPFERAVVLPRDVIVSCDGENINSPDQLERVLATHHPSTPLSCQGYRTGAFLYEFRVPADEVPETSSPEQWGYQAGTGRTIRARGTFSHFVTYAEVMLQLAALALGLWLACPSKRSRKGLALALLGLLLVAAMASTFTRASAAALLMAVLAMVWIRAGWRVRVALPLLAVLVLLGLNALLMRWRGVGFYSSADLSIQYRQMMWEDGLRLIGEYPVLGVGMDTVLTRWQDLGLRAYEKFRLHSHFHSTPIQLAVERGLVGLGTWLLLMGVYVVLLLRLVTRTRGADDWWSHGLALGILGSTTGFLTSSLVHYNFGDSEVGMVFWLLTGVAVALHRFTGAARPGRISSAAH